MLPFGSPLGRAARIVALAAGLAALTAVEACVRPSASRPMLQQPEQRFKDYADSATRQKARNKGWGDEQRLALIDSTGPYPLRLRHGPLVRIIPHDDLEAFRMEEFQVTGWQFVARFEVTPLPEFPARGYPKLSLDTGNVNYLFLRHSVADGWQALIGPGCENATITFACSGSRYRVDELERHEAGATATKVPPGTARFVWSDDDETVWIRCVSGCCQLGAKISL